MFKFFRNQLALILPLLFVIVSSILTIVFELNLLWILLFLFIILVLSVFFWKLEYLFYILVFLFPITTVFHSYYAVDLIALTFLFSFFLRFLRENLLKNNTIKIRLPLIFSFLLFFLSVILSLFSSFNILFSIKSVLYLVFLYLAYISFPVSVITKKEQIFNILKIFAFIGLVDAFAGFFSLFGQKDSGVIYGAFPTSIFGKNFLGTSRNTLAQILTVAIPALIALIYFFKDKNKFKTEKERRIVNFFMIASLIFIIGINVLTLSRSSMITMFVTFFIIIVGYTFLYKRKYFSRVIVALSLMILMLGGCIYFLYSKSQREGFSGSLDYRYGIAEISIDMFYERPIFGHGFGMFKTLLASNSWHNANYSWGGVTEAHSWLQKILVEQGIFGVVCFLLFLFNMYYYSIKYFFNEKNSLENRMLMLFLIAIATSQIVFNVFDWMYYNFRMWIPMSLPLILISIDKQKYNFIITNEQKS